VCSSGQRDKANVQAHQIRVHLQFLGHPISNDPLYGTSAVWGDKLGKGGIDLVPEETSTSVSQILEQRQHAATSTDSKSEPSTSLRPILDDSDRMSGMERLPAHAGVNVKQKVSDEREMGNIELSSPIRLSRQAKEIIAKLRRMKDEAEDWVKCVTILRSRARAYEIRWKEVIFTTQQAQESLRSHDEPSTAAVASTDRSSPSFGAEQRIPLLPQSHAKQIRPEAIDETHISQLRRPEHLPPGFCDQCYVPLPDDPSPETLFIYLHALSYTTEQLGKWATPMPRWTMEDWDGDWRGWADGQEIKEVLVKDGVVVGGAQG
jgi:hypothetical protein